MCQSLVPITGELKSAGERLTSHYLPKDLHRLRINIRRIRSLLKQMDSRRAGHFRKTWGGFAAVTNQARDLDVFLKSAKAILPAAEFAEFSEMLTPQLLASHEAVIEILRSAQWRRHLTDWDQFLERGNGPVADASKPRWSVQQALDRARSACALALAVSDDRTWHKFRIAVKNLRYIADASLDDPDCDQQYLNQVIAACRVLQTRLGKWHDTVVQLQMIGEPWNGEEERTTVMKDRLAAALEHKKKLLLSKIRKTLAEQTLFATTDAPSSA